MKIFSNRSLVGPQTPAFSMARDVVRIVIAAVLAGTGFALLLALTVLSLTVIAPPAQASGAPVLASAEPDQAAGPPTEKPGEQTSGSFLVRVRPSGRLIRSPALSTDVKISVSGMVARAVVAQQFKNDSPDWIEGVYVFPLPENAAVDRLRMQVGDRQIEGQIRERAQARAEYEAARDRGSRASLVEQERPNIFTSSVANLGPGETLTVEIEYQQTLRYEDAAVSLRFPTVVAPRYIPGKPQSEAPRLDTSKGSGWAANTDQVPDASRITPPVVAEGEQPRNPVTLHVELDAGFPVGEVKSRYHAVTVEKRDDNRYEVSLGVGPFAADRDFELVWHPLAGAQPRGSLFRETKEGETHLLLTIFPPVGSQATEKRLPREAIYVIDTSGSMQGASLEQARKALHLALRQLTREDRFNVIQFNSVTDTLFASPREANEKNLEAARHYVDKLHATGGTEMAPALRAALDAPAKEGFLRQVVFMTDGSVGNEDELFKLIQKKLGRSRLFTVGIGSAPNSHFMTKAAQLGRGSFTYIGDIAEVGEKMGALFGKLEHPVLSDIVVEWPASVSAEGYPQKLPDLYLGEPVVLSARAEGLLRGKVVVRGQSGEQSWSSKFDLGQAHDGKGMGVIWARRKIESLTDSLQDGANKEKVREAVVDIALKHHLVTRYTSLVAVDVTPVRPEGEALDAQAVPANLPQGWSHEGVFGSLPKTATSAGLHLILALLAGALAVLVYARRKAVYARRKV
ncbi:MAG: marine proteobacterial sortase target protein [Betaproteobacteria bacterium]|nr:marine proteobacterial sortase target protein [Betaproteobacteria bacterium]